MTTGSSITSSSLAYQESIRVLQGNGTGSGSGRRGVRGGDFLSGSHEEGWTGGSPLKSELVIPQSPCPSELPLAGAALDGGDVMIQEEQEDSVNEAPMSGQIRRGSFFSEDVVFRMEHWSLTDLPPPADL
jgi:hypothetical protein